MAINIDWKQFKHVKTDNFHTTLKHKHGHELKIAHKLLSPESRAQLEALKGGNLGSEGGNSFAKGGKVASEERAALKSGPKDAKMDHIPVRPQMADGGKVADKPAQATSPTAQPAATSQDLVDSIQDPQLKATIEAEPRRQAFADGGGVQPAPGEVGSEIPYDQLIPQEQAQNAPYGTADAQPVPTPQTPAQSAPEPAQTPQAQSDTAQSVANAVAPPPDLDPTAAYQNAAGAQLRLADAEGKAGQEEAAIQHKAAAQQDQALAAYNQHHDQLVKEYNGFVQDVQNQHIDPKHYMNSLGAGQKVGTAIGLILGGIGAGMTHGPNVAAEMLQHAIDNDVSAQQAELGKKQGLLSANLRQFGNLNDATNMTRVMQAGVTGAKIQEAMAKTQDPKAQAAAQMALAQLQQTYYPLMQETAMRQMLAKGVSPDTDPSVLANYLPRATPAQKAEVGKEISKNVEINKLRQNFQSSFDDLSHRVLAGHLSPADRASAINAFGGQIAKLAEGRFNLEEAKLQAAALLPGIESDETRSNKQARLNQFFDSLLSPGATSKSLGLDLSKFKSTAPSDSTSRLSPQQKAWVDYARAHPENPNSAIMLKKLGVQ